MSVQKQMRRFARWHIWLGWLVGVPILMWTVTGLVMVAKPIEEVRGNHLRIAQPAAMLPREGLLPLPEMEGSISGAQLAMQREKPVWFVTYENGAMARIDAASGAMLPPVDEEEARAIATQEIVGGDAVERATLFEADAVPFDFRRPLAAWQLVLADGTHVYIGRDIGRIEAVRTRWWRIFDTMWGLHIMDLQTREDTSHPILILFAALGAIGSLLGCILMFRRRKARVTA